MEIDDYIYIIFLPVFSISYFYIRLLVIMQLRQESPDLIKKLCNPSLLGRMGNEPFTNFILLGKYNDCNVTNNIKHKMLVLRVVIIFVLLMFTVYPIIAISNFLMKIN